MFNVYIIGAGQIGSRHFQALKRVKFPLSVTVVDPSEQSLAVAKKRYEEMPKGRYRHEIKYLQEIDTGQKIDLIILATTSNVRAKIIKDVLKKNQVRYFILEKIVFNKKSDYYAVKNILSKSKIKAWVNLPRRIRPIYKKIKEQLIGRVVSVRGIGSQWGLACNAVHFLDLISYLTGDCDYTVDTHHLDKKISLSKRRGFLEIHGTLYANFKKGSRCELSSHTSGNAPLLIDISNDNIRYIIREPEGKYWASNARDNWRWEEVSFRTPLVSETTTLIVENILTNGDCPLTSYEESIKTHLLLLEPLRHFLNKNSEKKYEHYPFT
ncbi:MAG: hypothetical protein A3I26_00320 [Candidatus Yanofskybacteria bacterium RIFCSPLOWO2_02_FULL_43_10]|uniref:Gfo/Idh/MocA-like oxidoreductase N-terminal domain-containing protein n=1 Tax=Candidatus Yanofskybacteria bacterium RIFCSPLOWO2_12_FULL_43_11b TaxID=1802710 RepID=A0A1F8H9B9_9BACT|nr:MAG: hypothetical protein A2742_00330 [Candidatus Yanofskybacteria bacterium RIFCSPHIGHO2_01_FULL_43_32]OGN11007.1 MAG: hypothetical protein A3C69_03470 [Candidatus Yanofskybacteria bacterium RIFCSPHIGHO2_02_FULL_43_12]OGN18158.1 MAG: hypothetical protein A3E34_02865 [Candidatus Yanofskybacteria bacterium RIFCSPHIGHO2_12_FULL_43_11]OGN24134.1 MAG: hypothetical protein A2923_02270 [Candidatus Yanofskybacteria bacterium RIFCSPLOWO2_01_FULL_43_46]OGN30549.1 MAG: hypothetical protein A3I26_00320